LAIRGIFYIVLLASIFGVFTKIGFIIVLVVWIPSAFATHMVFKHIWPQEQIKEPWRTICVCFGIYGLLGSTVTMIETNILELMLSDWFENRRKKTDPSLTDQ